MKKTRNKLAFILKNAFASFLHREERKVNFIIMLSMAAGMLFPIIALGNCHATVQDLQDMNIKQADCVYSVNAATTVSAKEIATVAGAEDYMAVYATQSNFSLNGTSFSAFVYGIPENFDAYIPCHVTDGSLTAIFDSTTPKAVVEEGFFSSKGLPEFSLPVRIAIDGVEVEIVGKIRCPLYAQTIFVSTQSIRKFYNGFEAQIQQLLIKSTNSSSVLLQESLRQIGIDATVTKATQVNDTIRTSSISNTNIVLLLGLLSLAFSFIDVVEIVTGKLIRKKKVLAIKLAVGSSKLEIFCEVLFENIFLGTVSTLIALFVALLLIRTLPIFTNVVLDTSVALISWFVCIAVFLLTTLLACIVVTKQNIINLLRSA